MKVLFTIERDQEAVAYTWDDPAGGGIKMQAKTFAELSNAVSEAVRCHFAGPPLPKVATLHFDHDPDVSSAL